MLTDTGPLTALFDSGDQNHSTAREILSGAIKAPLVTTCPCFTEALYLLSRTRYPSRQYRLLQMVELQTLDLHHLTPAEDHRAFALMRQYRDRPMSYADASLIATAESLRLSSIFTFDSDFRFYRLADGSTLEVIP